MRAKKRAFSVKTKGSAKRGSTICRNASWRHRRRWWDSRVDRQRVGGPDEEWGPCGCTCISPTRHCDEPSIGPRNKVTLKTHPTLVIQSFPPWKDRVNQNRWIDHIRDNVCTVDTIKNYLYQINIIIWCIK